MAASLRLGVLGDLHLVAHQSTGGAWHNAYDFAGVSGRLPGAARAFQDANVDAVCLIGDLTHDGSTSSLAPVVEALAGVEVPILVADGNHDPGGHGAVAAALPTAEAAGPTGRLIGGWRLAGLQVTSPSWFGASCDVPPAVEAWGEEPVVLISHFPILSHAVKFAKRGMPYPGDLLGREPIARTLTDRAAPTIVVSGHLHARDSSHHQAVLQIAQAALVEAPYECGVLELTATEVVRRAIELPGPQRDGLLPVLVEAEERFTLVAGVWQPAISMPETLVGACATGSFS